jgi:hypothetical protein
VTFKDIPREAPWVSQRLGYNAVKVQFPVPMKSSQTPALMWLIVAAKKKQLGQRKDIVPV